MKRKLKRTLFCSLLFLVMICLPGTMAEAAKLRLNKNKIQMRVGEKVTLKVKGSKTKKATWKSSKPKVAKVTNKGVVKAKKKGKTVIRAKVDGKTLKCKVTVKKAKKKAPVNDTKIPDTNKPTPDTNKPTPDTETETDEQMGTNKYTEIMDKAVLDDLGKSTRSLTEYEGVNSLTNNLTAALPTLSSNETFTGLQDFSWRLFAQVQKNAAKGNKSNVVISPVSAYTALAMIAQGSLGNTQAQFSELLGLSDSMLKQNTNISALKRHLTNTKGQTALSIANSIWLDEKFGAKQSFLQSSVDYFDSEIYSDDLTTDDTKNAVNKWVSEKTNGLISNLLNKNFTEDTVAVLINALYLNAKWKTPFSTYDTTERTFTKEDGTKVTVEFVGTEERTMDYIKTSKAEGVLIPYDDDKTVFLALRPTDGTPVKDFAASLNAVSVKRYISQAEEKKLHFNMPKFEQSSSTGLNSILQEMGLIDAFCGDTADFRDMCETSSNVLYLGFVQQDVKIKVAEKGTEAAAVTMGGMQIESAPVVDVYLSLNTPYVYIVMDLSTQAPLFTGVMEDPASKQ